MVFSHVFEVASGPQNLAQFGIKQEVIDRLQGLDLSGRVHDFTSVRGNGAYADVSQAKLRPSSEGGATTPVAIKRMRFYLSNDLKALFEKEIYVWSKLRHENVATLLGYAFDTSGYPLLVSAWMENGSAWNYVTQDSRADVLPLIIGIAKGLNYLHEEMDATHSDIKGANILVSDSNPPRAVICDFGMSRIVNASLTLGRPSPTRAGTARWLAYEGLQLEEQHAPVNDEFVYTKKMDVWSFGMTIYELYTRRMPYDKCANDVQVILAISSRKLPQFDGDAVDLRGELFRKICQECWKFSPVERPTIRRVLDMLPN